MGLRLQSGISIHALREEGDRNSSRPLVLHRISIHALREEGDFLLQRLDHFIKISIHALREEGDAANTPLSTVARNFYPRPPRGGRRAADDAGYRSASISIHALREEGDQNTTKNNITGAISIHALREEGDLSPFASRRP